MLLNQAMNVPPPQDAALAAAYGNQLAPGFNFGYNTHPTMQYLPADMIHMTSYQNL